MKTPIPLCTKAAGNNSFEDIHDIDNKRIESMKSIIHNCNTVTVKYQISSTQL